MLIGLFRWAPRLWEASFGLFGVLLDFFSAGVCSEGPKTSSAIISSIVLFPGCLRAMVNYLKVSTQRVIDPMAARKMLILEKCTRD